MLLMPRLRLVSLFLLAALVSLTLSAKVSGSQAAIVIDGQGDDWSAIPVAYQDLNGDGPTGGIDLGRLWISDDDRFLFLRFEIGTELILNGGNNLFLYLDTDVDSNTGLAIGGIGAELEWGFGVRQGTVRLNGGVAVVSQNDLRFRGGLQVSDDVFEIAIGRDTLPDGSNPLFLGSQIRVLLLDTTISGDQLPNIGATVTYTMDIGSAPPVEVINLGKQQSNDLRLITYNVLNDSPWTPGNEARFGAQWAAANPDILNFQEIYNHSSEQTIDLVDNWVALGPGEIWYGAKNHDCITISRYPILDSWPIDNNLAVLIDTSVVLGTSLLIINVHLPCCANNSGRQREVDNILSFLRDSKQPGGLLELPWGTPIVFTGDTNFVGFAQQLTSILTGDIVDEATYGPDFITDWDGSDLDTLISRQTEKRMAYTWRNDSSTFWPGHLDYVVYTDSVLDVGNHFVLYTPEMSPASLSQFSLSTDDSEASDHLLVCADFRTKLGPAIPATNCRAIVVMSLLFLTSSAVLCRRRLFWIGLPRS